MRRFWREVGVDTRGGGFGIALDGKPVRTPVGRALIMPTRALAQAVAQEWAELGERFDPSSLPLTQLANTALDRTPLHREAMAQEFARYGAHDVLCFPAPGPDGLVRLQAERWEPVRGELARRYGLDLAPVAGLVRQVSEEQEARAQAVALARDDFALTGLLFATALFGSAGLALMLADAVLEAGEAFALSRLEEAWQESQWGVDAEAALRTQAHARDANVVGCWFGALAQA